VADERVADAELAIRAVELPQTVISWNEVWNACHEGSYGLQAKAQLRKPEKDLVQLLAADSAGIGHEACQLLAWQHQR
jgi:hypothetical protein